MKRTICLIILFTFIYNTPTSAQEWSEPVEISKLQGYNSSPDFYIANNGIIHVVWSYRLEANHRIIYYSKSEDDGLTWSEAENISQNNTLWMENPHVVVDSDNQVYISYDYNAGNPSDMLIFLRKYNGEYWSAIDTVSNGWYGSDHNSLYIDNNDRVYCFWYCDWYNNNGSMVYRYYENDQWSDFLIPYDNSDVYFIGKIVIDNNNILHCSAYHYYYYQSNNDLEIVYSTCQNNNWSNISQVSVDYKVWVGNDLAINNLNHPQIVWRQTLSNSAPPNDGSLYAFYDGTEWSDPEIIVEDPSDQAIVIDSYNKTHIIDNEKYEDGYRLIHYQKKNAEWIGEIINEDNYGNFLNKLINKGNLIYLVNGKVDTIYGASIVESNIVLRKYEVLVNTDEVLPVTFSKFAIFPNPISTQANIQYHLSNTVHIELKIYNLKGELIKTLVNKKQSTGTQRIKWNATDKNGKEVSPGLYLIRLKAGKQIMTRSVEVF
ncbi:MULTISPECIES: FlgD immunoglobulin-like domain containing protein [unclassified Lentimicrobium]|uniref:FlgD immunoglobulin-like domain containing protein n=1 Tax=unclassified Lentimicrobium TaxID=2677434 RepID=UPI0015528E52|nr:MULTISPECIES: FlgD immunoglobulin-like domain containing protein [unclassified Lentimicrobium]NPD44518.1 T9SS type A sorting domain-containing protein [Lentimicrobium sp. S6]NPD86966.1 T9SS type A sorting domain-containing protein [Lentimicrobium sp. L6]